MHPPFGFALFFLRSVAPEKAYKDKVTGRMIEPVTSGQIYLGAIPYVVIQIIMVAIVIAFPRLVTHYKDGEIVVDPNTIRIEVPMPGATGDNPFGDAGNPFGPASAPSFGAPPAGGAPAPDAPGGLPAPSFGAPPPSPDPAAPGGLPAPSFGAPAPAQP